MPWAPILHAGDGAGILVQIPHAFFKAEAERLGFKLPRRRAYGVGDSCSCQTRTSGFARAARTSWAKGWLAEEHIPLIGWRDVPVDNHGLPGKVSSPSSPAIGTSLVGRKAGVYPGQVPLRTGGLYVAAAGSFRTASSRGSLGSKDVKFLPAVSLSWPHGDLQGLLLADQVGQYYKDLQDARVVSALALVHQRFSTNTFPNGRWRIRTAWSRTTARSTP